VVFQGVSGDGCQFSFACDGSMRRAKEAEAWRRAETIAARALTGFVMPSVGNATHFHVIGVDPGWGPNLLKVAQVGLHVFYRFGGYAGAPSSFTAQPERSQPDATLVQASTPAVETTSADGRPAGQYILASASVSASSASTPPPSKPAAPAPDPAAPVKADASQKGHADSGA
jgi:hypothetical protein